MDPSPSIPAAREQFSKLPPPSLPPETPTKRWPVVKRILFRFAAIYFVLYTFPFPIQYLLMPLSWIPKFGPVVQQAGTRLSMHVNNGWNEVCVWVGKHGLGIESELYTGPTGSGDTTVNYIQLLIMVSVALIGCGLWTLVDRKRNAYRVLPILLTIGCRYYLAFVMFSYGFAKVIKTQFPFPGLDRLMQPIGDMSPMGLTWTFMGYSNAYNIFTGGGEVVGGLLLLFRRTRTLGALVTIGVMINVVMLNFCYDVPVKLFSSHLLLMAMLIASLDGHRLLSVLLLNRPAPTTNLAPYVRNLGFRITAAATKIVIIAAVLYSNISGSIQTYQSFGDGRQLPPLYGIHEVESFEFEGEVLPPLLTDTRRWRAMVVDRPLPMFGRPGYVSIWRMNGTRQMFAVQLDTDQQTISFFAPGNREEVASVLTYRRPTETTLVLTGTWQDHPVEIILRERDLQSYNLVGRGYNWINELPYNR